MSLRGLPSRLVRLPHRLPMPSDGELGRLAAEPGRGWYKTQRWRTLRLEILKRDLWRCRWPGCGVALRPGAKGPRAAVVDHVTPHDGDEALFWDPENLQALCKPCHDGPKQALDRERRGGGGR